VCVERATNDASIVVKYTDGSSVVGATVAFYGCDLGTTGNGLPIHTKVPAAWGSLTVRDGQNEYTECHSYEDLGNMVVTIPRSKHFIFNFHTVSVSKSGSSYTIDSISDSTDRVEVTMERAGDICDPPAPEIIVNFDEGEFVAEKDVANLPVTFYNVSVGTYSGQSFTGFANMTGFMPAGTEVHVYAPSMAGYSGDDVQDLIDLMDGCGISPVSNTEYSSKVGCSWTG
jgi:hypothetical protein